MMAGDGFGRRLLVALADASPAFRAQPESPMGGFGRRLLVALADASSAFRPLRAEEELHQGSSEPTPDRLPASWHIVLADFDRLVVTQSTQDNTVYVLRPPGEDPAAILRAARLVLPESAYRELATRLGLSANRHIVMVDYDRLVVTQSTQDNTVYVLRPPGEDPAAILRAASSVLPESAYRELAEELGMPASRHIVMVDYDRLVVTQSTQDNTVYVLRPPGEDPAMILRAASLVLPVSALRQLAEELRMPANRPTVMADYDRLVLTRSTRGSTVYELRPPGEDPAAILRAASSVLPESAYRELAEQIG
jgi:hypothetical protein